MNPIDFALIAVLIVGFIWGFSRRFVYMIFSLIAIIGGVFAAGKLSPLIVPHLFSRQYLQVGYVVLFIIIFTLIYFIIRKLSYLVEDLVAFMELEWLDSLLGGVLGLAQFLIIAGIFVSLVYQTGIIHMVPGSGQARFAPLISHASRSVIDFIAGNLQQNNIRL